MQGSVECRQGGSGGRVGEKTMGHKRRRPSCAAAVTRPALTPSQQRPAALTCAGLSRKRALSELVKPDWAAPCDSGGGGCSGREWWV